MKKRPIAFILAATDHGTMILNRNDYHKPEVREEWHTEDANGEFGYGIGFELFNTSSFSMDEVKMVKNLLYNRKLMKGSGVVALDIGANIGTHTIEWAKYMSDWGSVVAFEAQERVFYALAGNIALNNCFNAKAVRCAVGRVNSFIHIPRLDYTKAASFGSLELTEKVNNQDIGQVVDYGDCEVVSVLTIDMHDFPRVDFMKIDVEGMEMDVLKGSVTTVLKYKPIIMVEYIKSDMDLMLEWLWDKDYRVFKFGINLLAIHEKDTSHMLVKGTEIKHG